MVYLAAVPPGVNEALVAFGAWFEPFCITVAVFGFMIGLVLLTVLPLMELGVVLSPLIALVGVVRRIFK